MAIELIFKYMNCSDTQKVHCAIYMLRHQAHFWWESVLRSFENKGKQVTWEQFREAFFQKYYPRTVRFQIVEEFIQLKQGERPVEEYEHEFTRLSHFAPNIVRTDEAKTERFINGLNWDIQGHVSAHASLNYAEAVKVATVIDNANRRNTRGPNKSTRL